ncbi:hypothetical protein [Alkalibacterium gilvum]
MTTKVWSEKILEGTVKKRSEKNKYSNRYQAKNVTAYIHQAVLLSENDKA